MLFTETGAFAELIQRWSFQRDGVEITVDLAADAVRLVVAGAEVDEDARLSAEQTSWLGASAKWAGSTHAIEAVVGSSQGTVVCKLWVDAEPAGEHASSVLRYPEPLQWAAVRSRAWLRLLGRAATRPGVLLVGALLGGAAAIGTPVPGHALTAAMVGIVLCAGWQADKEWQQMDLPYQRRKARLQGSEGLSEPVTKAQRWIGGALFAVGAYLVLSSALLSVTSVRLAGEADEPLTSVLAASMILVLGPLGAWVLRHAQRIRKPSLSSPLWSPRTRARHEVLQRLRHSAEQLKAQATAEKLASMPPISGVQLQSSPRGLKLCFDAGLTRDTFAQLLAWLAQEDLEFALYDALYPQISDPGAYLSYRPMGEVWQMTLGNHGWSGGIYQIELSIVCQQLANLYAQGELENIGVEGVVFFSHYALASSENNAQMSRRLDEIHRAPSQST